MISFDTDLLIEFYQRFFGWKHEQLSPDMGNYILLTTTENDVKPGESAGAINGRMFPFNSDKPGQHPWLVIVSTDMNETINRINQYGGKALGEPMTIPNTGLYIAFLDPEGSRLSILQPKT